nr:cation channel sperm-associated protein subunit beta-like [Zootoca vivipara]
MPNRVLLNTDIPPGRWFLYDFGTETKRKWKIVVDICRYTIQQFDDLPRHAIKYLDIGSKLEFKFRVTPVNIADYVGLSFNKDKSLSQVWISFDGGCTFIPLLTLQAEMIIEADSCVYTQAIIFVTDAANLIYTKAGLMKYAKFLPPAKGIFNMYFDHPGVLNHISLNETVNTFVMEMDVDVDTLLKPNYRPPSVLGIAVPLTENFYNADPSKPKQRDYFTNSKNSGQYKQCAGKSKRSECGCTENMKLSFSVAFSDCKEKVRAMPTCAAFCLLF